MNSNPIKKYYQAAYIRILLNRIIAKTLQVAIFLLWSLGALHLIGINHNDDHMMTILIILVSAGIFFIFYNTIRNQPSKAQILASIDHHFHTRGILSILIDPNIELQPNVFNSLLNRCQKLSPILIFKKYRLHFRQWHLLGAALCFFIILKVAVPDYSSDLVSDNSMSKKSAHHEIKADMSESEILSMLENNKSNNFSNTTPKNGLEVNVESEEVKKAIANSVKNWEKTSSQNPENNLSKNQSNEGSLEKTDEKSSGTGSGAGNKEDKENKTTEISLHDTNDLSQKTIDLNMSTKTNSGGGESSETSTEQPNKTSMLNVNYDTQFKSFKASKNWSRLNQKYKIIIEEYFKKDH